MIPSVPFCPYHFVRYHFVPEPEGSGVVAKWYCYEVVLLCSGGCYEVVLFCQISER